MIDEWYDRTYQQGRAELNHGIARLLTILTRPFRKLPTTEAGEMPCAPDPSRLPASRCR